MTNIKQVAEEIAQAAYDFDLLDDDKFIKRYGTLEITLEQMIQSILEDALRSWVGEGEEREDLETGYGHIYGRKTRNYLRKQILDNALVNKE